MINVLSSKFPTDFRRLKIKFRLIFRIASFTVLVVGFTLFNMYNEANTDFHILSQFRKLSSSSDSNELFFGNSSDGCPEGITPKAMVIVLVIFVLWLFVGLAIVADDFFVPALDLIAEIYNIPPDVAGATLMAAGGSSPELFASGVGTFLRSSVGFGAIVGSAVFNVLFVVGVCAIVTKTPMQLTWYPMMRDSLYYCFVLVLLAIFVGASSPKYISWWEALLLHAMYWLYVYIMYNNTYLFNYFNNIKSSHSSSKKNVGIDSQQIEIQLIDENPMYNAVRPGETVVRFNFPSAFRQSVFTLMTSNKPLTATVGTHLVNKLNGSIDEIFSRIDKSKDGCIDKSELKCLFMDLGCSHDDDAVDKVMKDLDLNHDGWIDLEEFTKWYIVSSERAEANLRDCFNEIDKDKNGSLSKDEIKEVLKRFNSDPKSISDGEIDNAVEEMYNPHGLNESETNFCIDSSITFQQFSEWFKKSDLMKLSKAACDQLVEEVEGINIYPPKELTFKTLFWYLITIPQVFCFWATIPDIRKPGNSKYVFTSFFVCLGWFGLISYFMVKSVEIIGATIGIPSFLMGLTFLAMGTSVPDMLSAVIVANQGEGDKAVSSSIGSNVFDICVGLAFPWLLFWITYQEDVYISADGVALSIVVLLVCLGVLIFTLWYRKWLLPKSSGYFFIVVYFLFVAEQCAVANWGSC